MLKKVLSIETSCDDTSVAIVGHDGYVHELVSASQDDVHAPFGGIVPEIACRNHSFQLLPLVEKVMTNYDWNDIHGIAVTNRPGLVGSLIVGLVTAKTLAQLKKKPFIGVNHLEGHLLAPFLRDDQYQPSFSHDQPFVALAVSGGHTSLYKVKGLGQYRVLGSTRDDAAGEAYDKFAKMIGLGFPGGVNVDRLAQTGNPKAFDLPRALLKEDTFEMSFSGLKSSAQRMIEALGADAFGERLNDLCASFQEAVSDVLVSKLNRAIEVEKVDKAILTGGVSANSRLRSMTEDWANKKGIALLVPPLRYCTDNAAMIGYSGILRMQRGERSDLSLGPSPQALPGDFNVFNK
ncbi:MAG: O-sialoglycoprotein endopeptidase [Pseudomonadota bacterium]|jgi:N6-L-threonylcarbamoyladenine synthase